MEMADTLRLGYRKLADDAVGALRDLIGPTTPANIRLRAVELVLTRVAGEMGNEQIGSPIPDEIQAQIDAQERLKKELDMFRS
jgi:hypothetical protein